MAMPSTQIRTIHVGVGNFGAYRRDRMRETGLFQQLACFDYNATAMAEAEARDGAKPCASFEQLLATPGAQALIVSTGAKFHAEQLLAALDRGLHVFCEKPLCATWDEVKAILTARRKYPKQVIGMGHNHHGAMPGSFQIKQLIDSGALGKIVAIEKTTGHSGGFHIKPGDWRGDPVKNPGGMLFQCGVHAFHELMYLFGPIVSIQAHMRYDVNPDTQTADSAQCLVRFANGLHGTVNAYHVIPYRHHLTVFGTLASLYRDDRYGPVGTQLVMQKRIDNQFEPHEPIALTGTDDATANLRSWHAAILKGSDDGLFPNVFDGARAVLAVFAAEESAKTGRPVAVPDVTAL
jgi:predicted dehydrogenase